MACATKVRRLGATEIAGIFKSPSRARSPHFALCWRQSAGWGLGMVVSRKLAGNAVLRNRLKRQVRAAFGHCRERIGRGGGVHVEVVLRVTANVRGLARGEQFEEISRLFDRCMQGAAARAS